MTCIQCGQEIVRGNAITVGVPQIGAPALVDVHVFGSYPCLRQWLDAQITSPPCGGTPANSTPRPVSGGPMSQQCPAPGAGEWNP